MTNETIVIGGKLKSFQYKNGKEEFYICLPEGLNERFVRELSYQMTLTVDPRCLKCGCPAQYNADPENPLCTNCMSHKDGDNDKETADAEMGIFDEDNIEDRRSDGS